MRHFPIIFLYQLELVGLRKVDIVRSLGQSQFIVTAAVAEDADEGGRHHRSSFAAILRFHSLPRPPLTSLSQLSVRAHFGSW